MTVDERLYALVRRYAYLPRQELVNGTRLLCRFGNVDCHPSVPTRAATNEITTMPRYLIQASYTAAAAAAFVSKPQDRVAGVRAAVEKLGGKLESFDFCLGEHDVIGVAEFPDDTTAAALALAVNAPGHLRSYRTTRLLSAQEFLAAQQKAHGVSYQAPAKA